MIQQLFVEPQDFGCTSARVIAITSELGTVAMQGHCLVEFECEKASFEISMPAAGIIQQLHLSVGETVVSKTLVATIEVDDDTPVKFAHHADRENLDTLRRAYTTIVASETFADAVSELETRLLVRPSERHDIAAITEIWRGSFASALSDESLRPQAEATHETWFATQLNNASKHFLTAVLRDNSSTNDSVIGFGNLEIIERTPVTRFGIVGLHVVDPTAAWTPSHRLFERLTLIAKEHSLTQLHAYILPANRVAIRLLVALGFEEAGLIPGADSSGSENRAIYVLNF